MKNLKFDHRNYQLKSQWSELSKKELLKVFWLLSSHNDAEDIAGKQACLMNAFRVLSDVPDNLIANIDSDQWLDILQNVEWIFEPPVFEDNPMPIIRLRFGRDLIGPEGLIHNLSFGEFRAADDAFIQFMNDGDSSAIWRLVAILYRPKRRDLQKFKQDARNWNGDEREEFNWHIAKERAKRLSRSVKFYQAVGVLLYYWSARQKKLATNPTLKALFSGFGRSSALPLGWFGTLLEVAGPKFGAIEETDRQNFMVILVDMAKEMDKAERIREQLNKK